MGSILVKSLRLIPAADRKKLAVVTVAQTSLGLLDLAAVVFLGALGALAVAGVQSKSSGNKVTLFLNFLHLENLSFQSQVGFFGLIAATLFILRTFLSVVISKRVLRFLGIQGAKISSEVFRLLLTEQLIKIQKRSSQELLYTITVGVETITLGVLATGVSLIADVSLALILGAGLFVLDPIVAAISLLLFSIVGFFLYKQLHEKARNLGSIQTGLNIRSAQVIFQAIDTYRESFVRNTRAYYADNFRNIRFELSSVNAELKFMPNLSKYVIETAVIVGALLVSAVQFIRLDASHAIATLTVFLAAGARIAPAILRLQQGSILVRSSLGSATTTLDLIEELQTIKTQLPKSSGFSNSHFGFKGSVSVRNVSMSYLENSNEVLSQISLEVKEGSFIALVGESGAGKSSLVDVILGITKPNSGIIEIGGYSPAQAIQKWPGSIAYVPQDIRIINGTIEQNIALGFSAQNYDADSIRNALKIAQLDEFVSTLPEGILTEVGENGSKLSGGQRQRLGIARAFFTNPKLVIMDEATSSLDGITELSVSDSIQNMKGRVTLVLVAHRLATVRNADCVIYMKNGRIEARGTFSEVRSSVPDFEIQAQLMGL